MNNEMLNVINTVESMTKAVNEKNIAMVMSHYEDNAAIAFKPDMVMTNNQQVKLAFEEFFHLNPKFNYPNGHQVRLVDDIALHISPWQMSGTLPDGTKVAESGLSIAVLRKQPDGRWLMIIDDPNGDILLK